MYERMQRHGVQSTRKPTFLSIDLWFRKPTAVVINNLLNFYKQLLT